MAKRNNSDFIDLGGLFKQYLSKWYLFVISVVVCLALAFLYLKIKQPVYSVRANVLISQDDSQMGDALGAMGALGSLFGSDGYVEDEIFIISSHSLYSEVAKTLGTNTTYFVHTGLMRNELTYPNVPIVMTEPAAIADTLRTSMSFVVKVDKKGKAAIRAKMRKTLVADLEDLNLPYTLETPIGNFTFAATEYLTPGEPLKEIITFAGYDSAAEYLDGEIQNEIASKRSNVISLAINTTNPDYGKAILNQVIAEYNKRGILEKNTQTEQTAHFLDGRIEIIANDLENSEQQIQAYKQQRGIIDVEVEAKFQTEKRAKLEEALITARTDAEIVKMTTQFLQDPANAFSMIPASLDRGGLVEAVNAYNLLILEREDLAKSAKPNNPELKSLEDKINLSRANVLASANSALRNAQVAVKDIERELNQTESSLGNVPVQEREYINMKRQQEVQAQLYLYLLQRREEASLMLANSVAKGQVIDKAFTLGEPLGMGKKAVLLIALFFGLFLPPIYLYLRKLIHNRFETRQDVERLTDVPILGEMCVDRSGNSRVVSPDSTSSAAELFRLMRSNLLFILNNANDKVVLLTSSSSGEGKSFISINLAASLALLNKRVLLVGMDIRNPRLAEYLGISPRFGLTQYLTSDQISIDQIISPMPDATNLDVITAGPVPPNPAELLISHKVDELFETLRQRYDYIIVDTAPIGLVSDTFTLDRLADAAIYICRANYTKLSELSLVNDIYEQKRLKKLSLVINGTAAKKTYGYGKHNARS